MFSQFLDHLAIVREYVERRRVGYQYLDGSTPARDRKRRVDAFRAGEGEVPAAAYSPSGSASSHS